MHPTPIKFRSEIVQGLKEFSNQCLNYLVFAPVLVLSTSVLGIVIVVLCWLGQERTARRIPPLWARLNLSAARCRVSVTGAQVQLRQSCVVVANHQSHFDILALYGWLGLDCRWVMKQELRRIPVLGRCCASLGHIFVDRSNASQARAAIAAAHSTLHSGTCILFFPEGTRSSDATLRPFKMGAFRLAHELSLPILPITIHGSGRILPPHSRQLTPGIITLELHPPIMSPADQSVSALANAAHTVIAAALARGC